MARRRLTLTSESWPIAGSFTISRGSRTQADVIVVEVSEGSARGRGECVPYRRYGESLDGVIAQISSVQGEIEAGADRIALQTLLPAGAARNAVDCALVDLEAKQSGKRAWDVLGLAPPRPAITAYTISLGEPHAMAEAAAKAAHRPLLKIKLGGEGDAARIAAVRAAAPAAELIVDANEAWSEALLEPLTHACARAHVRLIEQPLPAGADHALVGFKSPIPLCADESCHDLASLPALEGKYRFANIKLDKAGGLTHAAALAAAAKGAGLDLMVGCMVGTSLAMAPAALLQPLATYIDLDGPLLLARDREPGLRYEGALVHPPTADLWG